MSLLNVTKSDYEDFLLDQKTFMLGGFRLEKNYRWNYLTKSGVLIETGSYLLIDAIKLVSDRLLADTKVKNDPQ